jgi:hypothetical protein
MNLWGTVLAAAGQSVELAGALWLLRTAWRAKRGEGSASQPMTLGDIPKLHQRIESSGYAPRGTHRRRGPHRFCRRKLDAGLSRGLTAMSRT